MATKQEILEAVGFVSEEAFMADQAFKAARDRVNLVAGKVSNLVRDGFLSMEDIENEVATLEKIIAKAGESRKEQLEKEEAEAMAEVEKAIELSKKD